VCSPGASAARNISCENRQWNHSTNLCLWSMMMASRSRRFHSDKCSTWLTVKTDSNDLDTPSFAPTAKNFQKTNRSLCLQSSSWSWVHPRITADTVQWSTDQHLKSQTCLQTPIHPICNWKSPKRSYIEPVAASQVMTLNIISVSNACPKVQPAEGKEWWVGGG